MIKLLPALLSLSVLTFVPPEKGQKAPDFELQTLTGDRLRLSSATAESPVVLVVLRGFPGYQCPLCNRQVKEFVGKANEFSAAGARVVMVYPGPGETLKDKANEFAADKAMPANFTMVLDPDYKFTNQYGLRWDAPQETAYPSTFILDKDGKVVWSKISKTHGGRSSAAEVLAELSAR